MSTSYACAAASAERDEPMFATGSQVRGWLLVEVRGAWGEDAIHASALGEHVPQHWKDELKRRHIRVVCIRSHERSRRPTCGSTPARPGAPASGPAPLWRRDVASLADVVRRRRGAPRRPAAESGVGARARAADPRVHQRAPRPMLRQPRPAARPRAARVAVGRAGCGSARTSAATDSPPTSSCCPTASTSVGSSRTRRAAS